MVLSLRGYGWWKGVLWIDGAGTASLFISASSLATGTAKTQQLALCTKFLLCFPYWSLGSAEWNTLIRQAELFREWLQLLLTTSFCRELSLCVASSLFLPVYTPRLIQFLPFVLMHRSVRHTYVQDWSYLLSFTFQFISISKREICGDLSLCYASDVTFSKYISI